MAKAPLAAQFLSFGTVLTVVIAVSIVKLHLLAMPLERDEGEYAYIAQLLMHGSPLYLNAFSAKLPAIYFFYAAVMALFGQSPFGIHLGLLFLNTATTVLVFLLCRRLFDPYTGTIAAAAFAILTLGKYALAFNIEHLVIFLVLGGLLLMLRAIERGSGFITSGVVFGLAFIAKQHAALFVLFGTLYLAWASRAVIKERIKRACLFLAGAAMPFAALCVLFYMQGVFKEFWFWVVTYASSYCAVMTIPDGIKSFFYVAGKVAGCASLIWVAALFGLLAAGRLERQKRVFVIGFTIASFLAMTPGFYFRHHYFIFLFPAMALLAGLAARPRRPAFTALFVLLFAFSVFQQRQFLFGMDPARACRDIYVNSPIVESVEVAKYIESRSGKDSRVIVLGSEPQIYFYLRRRAPVSYIYMYPLLEEAPYAVQMQERFKREIESANAEYVVGVHINTSWFNWYANAALAKPMFRWIDAYQKKYYDVVGVADMISRTETVYKWDSDAKGYKPRSDSYIVVLRRKPA